MVIKKSILLVSTLLVSLLCLAQTDSVSLQTESKFKSSLLYKSINKKNLVIAGLIVQQAGSSVIEYNWWWNGTPNKFHFEWDGFWKNYSYGIDKFGHAFTSYAFTVAINEAMKWAEFSDKQRFYTSIALPAFWAISIEIGDAFSPHGFSVTDLAANFSGIAYATLQEKYPSLKNVMFKFSYYPNNGDFRLSHNYDYHIYWLSFNMHNLLPKPIGKHWPELINLAAGYGIEGWNNYNIPYFRREFMIGIDLNLHAIKTKNKSVTAIRNILNVVHIPLPGFKHSTGGTDEFKWLLLY